MLPLINTAKAHKEAGIGMIGDGFINPPMDCFKKAAIEFAAKIPKLENQP